MQEHGLREIVVQAEDGARPEEVARAWAQRMGLADGVRIAVIVGEATTRPRRFVIYQGRVASPQAYAAGQIMGPLEDLLRAEGRPLDAWEILLAARRRASPVASAPMATIARAARLLAREGRLRHGPTPDSWTPPRDDATAAA